jgi:lipopolysaccharide transport system permease protein
MVRSIAGTRDAMTPASPARPATVSQPHIRIQPGRSSFDWRELWRFRDLFLILAQRDVKLRYRQTALGVIWVILQPLLASLLFAWIFGTLADLPSSGVPYVAAVFAAMLAWTLVSGGVQRAGNSLVSDSRLITKVYFPRAILPIASTAAVLVDFAVAAVVMVGILLVHGIPVGPTILALPLLVCLALAVTIGVSLLFSALNVYYRDFMYALPFLVQLWLYASPIVYSSSLVPDQWRPLYNLNPMVGIVDGFRWAFFGGPLPWLSMIESIGVGALLLVVGSLVFQRVERAFADVV